MNTNKIVAIVVTYNIGNQYLNNFKSLVNQVDKIVIVDNNSDEETVEVLKYIKLNNSNKVKIIFNEKNEGLAKAQNMGIEYANQENADWILLLDNDSLLDDKMVQTMIKKYLKYREKDKVAIISPMIIDKNSTKKTKYICKEGVLGIKRKVLLDDITDNILSTIASGSLVKTSVIKKIGNFKEEYFIDSVDTEFCMRAIYNGYRILVIKNAILYHELGQKRDYNILGLNITPTNHSALRRYYIYRNRIKMWREYWTKTPKYIVYEILASIYQIILIIIFENNKKQKLKMVCKGIREGARNISE